MKNSDSPSCPICGNHVYPKFSVPCDYRKPDRPKGYEIYWCLDCNYGLVWARPSKEEVSGFYDLKEYYTHAEIGSGASKQHTPLADRFRIAIAWRLDKGQKLEPREVLPFLGEQHHTMCEIGCGNGKILSRFQSAGFSVTGVEPDANALAMAKKVTPNVFDGTCENIPEIVATRKYDVVIMSHVLEHCLDVRTAVENAKSILKDGGVYVVETPNCHALGFRLYKGEWPWSDIPRHLNFFTPNSLGALLRAHGFDVVSVNYYGFCRQLSNQWLDTEEEIWSAFSRYSLKKVRPYFRARAWWLLFISIFAARASKYDSVRILGIKRR
jgi:2-polyprenyl-3-methyl-5-hydroxy-6-metoxy-1,4-benzoquinol methylase